MVTAYYTQINVQIKKAHLGYETSKSSHMSDF